MALTGSLYQDYTMLKENYDLYHKGILTRNPDTIFEMMLNMTIEDLSSFCSTNKMANQYCQSVNFWQSKFKHDDLPILKPFTIKTRFIQEYQLIKKAKKDAEIILKIGAIESKRDNKDEIYQFETVDEDHLKDIVKFLINKDFDSVDYVSLGRPNQNTPFEIAIGEYDNENQYEDDLDISEQFIIKFFTFVLRYYSDVMIVDMDNDPYLMTDQFMLLLDVNNIHYDVKTLSRRMGIADCLRFQND